MKIYQTLNIPFRQKVITEMCYIFLKNHAYSTLFGSFYPFVDNLSFVVRYLREKDQRKYFQTSY